MEIKAGLSALVTGGASGIGNTPIITSSSFSLFNIPTTLGVYQIHSIIQQVKVLC
jgi:hypothetical protein